MKGRWACLFVLATVLTGCISLAEQMGGYDALKYPVRGGQGSYYIARRHYEDLRGNVYVFTTTFFDSFPFLGASNNLIIKKIVSEHGEQTYVLEHHYMADKWAFIEEIRIAADGTVFTLKDERPKRDTAVYAGKVKVEERMQYVLSSEIIDALRNAKVVRFQYHGEPVTLEESQKLTLQSFFADTEDFTYANASQVT